MRKLLCYVSANDAERRKMVFSAAPLVEEGSIAKVKGAPKLAPKAAAPVKAASKAESKEPKRKGLTAQQFAMIFSAVMMLTAFLSQAATLVGCAKSVVEQKRSAVPVVTSVETTAKGDSQMNESAPMIMPKPPGESTVKPVPGPNSRLNQSLP